LIAMHNVLILYSFLFLIGLTGCGHVSEFSKTVWGSSTRALEQARVNGIVKTYDCSVSRCYDEVLQIVKENEYQIFIDNKAKATIVVMGIPGSVNTTEVGIFFSDISDSQTKIYVSSLSTNAKRKVAYAIFPQLDEIFGVTGSQATTTIDDQN
jgi:signal recognition particle GTPase